MTHPHLHVRQLVSGQEVCETFCLSTGWNISHITNSIVVGHGLPRIHIPLGNVLFYDVYDATEDSPMLDVRNQEAHDSAVNIDIGMFMAGFKRTDGPLSESAQRFVDEVGKPDPTQD